MSRISRISMRTLSLLSGFHQQSLGHVPSEPLSNASLPLKKCTVSGFIFSLLEFPFGVNWKICFLQRYVNDSLSWRLHFEILNSYLWISSQSILNQWTSWTTVKLLFYKSGRLCKSLISKIYKRVGLVKSPFQATPLSNKAHLFNFQKVQRIKTIFSDYKVLLLNPPRDQYVENPCPLMFAYIRSFIPLKNPILTNRVWKVYMLWKF